MKRMMLIGGVTGFVLATFVGVVAGESHWPSLLLRASVVALVCGWVARSWCGLIARCIVEARNERASSTANTGASSKAPSLIGNLKTL